MFDNLNIPSDIVVLSTFLLLVFMLAIVVYIKTKRVRSGVISFLILSNIVLFLNIEMEEFAIFKLELLQYFILFIFPIINLSIIIYYILKSIKTKKQLNL